MHKRYVRAALVALYFSLFRKSTTVSSKFFYKMGQVGQGKNHYLYLLIIKTRFGQLFCIDFKLVEKSQ